MRVSLSSLSLSSVLGLRTLLYLIASFPLLPDRRHYPSQSPVSCPFFPASHFRRIRAAPGFSPRLFSFLSFRPSLSLPACLCLSACQTLILRGKASYISPVSSFKPFRRSPPLDLRLALFLSPRFPRDKKRTKLEPEPEKQDATGISLFLLPTVSGKNKKKKVSIYLIIIILLFSLALFSFVLFFFFGLCILHKQQRIQIILGQLHIQRILLALITQQRQLNLIHNYLQLLLT